MINRIVAHRFRFLAHVSVAAALVASFLVLVTCHEYLEFLVRRSVWTTVAEFLILGGGAILLLYGHLSLLGTLSPVRKLSLIHI